MKRSTIFAIGLFLVFIVALAGTIVVLFTQGTAIGVGDGYTLFGSSQALTDLTASAVARPPRIGSYGGATGTDYIWDSKFWKVSYVGLSDGMFDKASTDENLKVQAVETWQNANSCSNCWEIYNVKSQLKVPINKLKLRVEATTSTNCWYYVSASTSLNIGNISIPIGSCHANKGGSNTASNVLIETIPNLFDNTTQIYVGGILKYTLNQTTDKTYMSFLTINGEDKEDSGGHSESYLTLSNARYQPLLSCQKDAQDLLAQQSFTGGSEITLDKFRFPVKQFCYGNPVMIIKGNESGIDTSYTIMDRLVQGQSMTVPQDEIWTIQYIFDNSAGLVSTICPSGQNLDENGVCKQQAGLVLAFSQGTLNTNTSTFTIEPQTICENMVGAKAIWDANTKTCTVPQPVINYCTDANGCTLVVSKICENSNLVYDSATQSCKSTSTIDPEGNITQNAGLSQIIIWTIIGLIGTIAIVTIILMLRRR